MVLSSNFWVLKSPFAKRYCLKITSQARMLSFISTYSTNWRYPFKLACQISSQFLRLTFMAEGSAASINASSSVSSLKLPTPIFCLTNAAISPDFVAVDLYTLGVAFGLGAAGFLATILPRHHLVNSMQIRESSLSYLPLLL
jgi:hypothetical protein